MRAQLHDGTAKNLIFFLGDGMGTQEITAARYYQYGAAGLRGCQGPKDMTACPKETKAAGGLASIAEQTVDHGVDVVLGGGRGRFNASGGPIAGGRANGKTVEQSAARQGYTEVNTAQDLAAIRPSDLPVLGLLNNGNMTTSGPDRSPPAATASRRTSA